MIRGAIAVSLKLATRPLSPRGVADRVLGDELDVDSDSIVLTYKIPYTKIQKLNYVLDTSFKI